MDIMINIDIDNREHARGKQLKIHRYLDITKPLHLGVDEDGGAET